MASLSRSVMPYPLRAPMHLLFGNLSFDENLSIFPHDLPHVCGVARDLLVSAVLHHREHVIRCQNLDVTLLLERCEVLRRNFVDVVRGGEFAGPGTRLGERREDAGLIGFAAYVLPRCHDVGLAPQGQSDRTATAEVVA